MGLRKYFLLKYFSFYATGRLKIVGAVLCIGFMMAAGIHIGIMDYFSNSFPFSANFIFNNPLKIVLIIGFAIFLGMISSFLFTKNNDYRKESLVLSTFTLVLGAIFQCSNPYFPLNWFVIGIPFVALGFTRRFTWFTIFLAIVVGLAIRRLTFINIYSPINLPDRRVLVFFIFLISVVILWWRKRRDNDAIHAIGLGAIAFIPAILAIALCSNVIIRAIILFLLIIPVEIAIKKTSKTKDIWRSLWVTVFLLGTSSSINYTTQIIAFPLFIAIWSVSNKAHAVVRGIMLSFGILTLYLLPGNGFDLKILELADRFILESATTSDMLSTVLVISARYIIPATILLIGLLDDEPVVLMPLMASTALIPVICGISARLIILNLPHAQGLPWEQMVRLVVLLGYTFILAFSFLTVGAIFSGKKAILWFCADITQKKGSIRISQQEIVK